MCPAFSSSVYFRTSAGEASAPHVRHCVVSCVSASVTSAAAATYDTRPTALDLRAVTGTRLWLLAGVRYRLTLATDAGTWTNAMAVLQVRSRRRRA